MRDSFSNYIYRAITFNTNSSSAFGSRTNLNHQHTLKKIVPTLGARKT